MLLYIINKGNKKRHRTEIVLCLFSMLFKGFFKDFFEMLLDVIKAILRTTFISFFFIKIKCWHIVIIMCIRKCNFFSFIHFLNWNILIFRMFFENFIKGFFAITATRTTLHIEPCDFLHMFFHLLPLL